MTFGSLLGHCLKTRYYTAEYDEEGRKKGGIRGTNTIESQIKILAEFFGAVKDEEDPEGVYVGGINYERSESTLYVPAANFSSRTEALQPPIA